MEARSEPSSGRYKLTQVFGTNEAIEVSEEDIISRLQYDPTGRYLCLGDNAGRIIIFQTGESAGSGSAEGDFDYYAEVLLQFRSSNRTSASSIPCAARSSQRR
jgi:hypothetical protein